MADKYPPSFAALKLYERTSAKGNPYMTGRWGGVRVAVLKTMEVDDAGNAIWQMRLSEAKPSEGHRPDRASSQGQALVAQPSGSADDIVPF